MPWSVWQSRTACCDGAISEVRGARSDEEHAGASRDGGGGRRGGIRLRREPDHAGTDRGGDRAHLRQSRPPPGFLDWAAADGRLRVRSASELPPAGNHEPQRGLWRMGVHARLAGPRWSALARHLRSVRHDRWLLHGPGRRRDAGRADAQGIEWQRGEESPLYLRRLLRYDLATARHEA